MYIYTYIIYKYIYIIYIYMRCRFKRKTEAQAIFHTPFAVCSATAPNFYGSILIQALGNKVIVILPIGGHRHRP